MAPGPRQNAGITFTPAGAYETDSLAFAGFDPGSGTVVVAACGKDSNDPDPDGNNAAPDGRLQQLLRRTSAARSPT